jgi:hypothetical protein
LKNSKSNRWIGKVLAVVVAAAAAMVAVAETMGGIDGNSSTAPRSA